MVVPRVKDERGKILRAARMDCSSIGRAEGLMKCVAREFQGNTLRRRQRWPRTPASGKPGGGAAGKGAAQKRPGLPSHRWFNE